MFITRNLVGSGDSCMNVPANWHSDVDLAGLTSFAVPARARFLVNVEQEDELPGLFARAEQMDLPVLVLGGGSNVLFMDNFPGLVIRIQLKGISSQSDPQDPDAILLNVSAGENWHELVQYTLKKAWYGLENLALIPGSVGAAPVQNIGAYGVELSDVLVSVRYLDTERMQVEQLSLDLCQFGYRDSIFKQTLKNRAVILSCRLRLRRTANVVLHYPALLNYPGASANMSPQALFEAVCDIRRSKLPDPAVLGNAGSFFRNPVVDVALFHSLKAHWPDLPSFPVHDRRGDVSAVQVKVPAAWLIEHAGWKGVRRGEVGVHSQQALVLVNYGGGTGREVLQLALDIAASVDKKFGIALQAEVRVLPNSPWQ
jgi:UDP-N-acetylmuramate dehydrogenase